MAGQGRPLGYSDRYPDATRLAETRKSFETSAEPGRFVTEGSVVRIHSPRPIFPENISKLERSWSAVVGHDRACTGEKVTL